MRGLGYVREAAVPEVQHEWELRDDPLHDPPDLAHRIPRGVVLGHQLSRPRMDHAVVRHRNVHLVPQTTPSEGRRTSVLVTLSRVYSQEGLPILEPPWANVRDLMRKVSFTHLL